MCNLYSVTKGQQAIRALYRAMTDRTGNMPPLPGIFPDQMAPVVRTGRDGARQLEMMRWGFPPPPNLASRPVTNIRNPASPFWRAWMKPAFRCLVPATSFCEYTDSTPKVPHWFALGPDRPLFAFAGLWRPWTGTRKGETGEHRLFAFLTTDANEIVRPIHAKAMPVILTGAECDAWLEGDVEEALALQRPASAETLTIVARGAREDPGPDGAAPSATPTQQSLF
jgi:putative SOS response-associated peptidase YedK